MVYFLMLPLGRECSRCILIKIKMLQYLLRIIVISVCIFGDLLFLNISFNYPKGLIFINTFVFATLCIGTSPSFILVKMYCLIFELHLCIYLSRLSAYSGKSQIVDNNVCAGGSSYYC